MVLLFLLKRCTLQIVTIDVYQYFRLMVATFCLSFRSEQLVKPVDVAISCDKHLLIAEEKNNCICIFTLNGHYVRKLGTRGSGRGQLCSPCGLATDLNGFIIVIDTCNNRVLIFDKYANCIHCFGSKGSANGQFNNSLGIAVSPNGSIYVSDYI